MLDLNENKDSFESACSQSSLSLVVSQFESARAKARLNSKSINPGLKARVNASSYIRDFSPKLNSTCSIIFATPYLRLTNLTIH